MKKFILSLLFLAPLCTFSQFSDNFSDGKFKGGTSSSGGEREINWSGNDDCFIVNDDLQLQLNAAGAASPAYLRTNSALTSNGYWEFWMKMDFNPTSSNYARVYLCSDEDNLTDELNGLFIRLGHTRKNLVLMSAQKGKNNKTLIEGTEKRLDRSSVSIHVKATLSKAGKFHLYSKLDDESDYTLEGFCDFKEELTSSSFGVVCNYTSTRTKLFYFDDFLARELGDDEQEIEEPNPDDPDPEDPEPEIPEFDTPLYGDIVFSEIMANPGDAGPEYVEMYNMSDKTFQLSDFLYYYGDKPYKLPEAVIKPKSYFVLCKNNALEFFSDNIKAYGVASFPTIANTTKLLMFGTTKEELISWFEYTDKMYGDDEKKKGGWSLECMDFSNKSNIADNWTGSINVGGTPGVTNSTIKTNPDVLKPEVKGIQNLENNVLRIDFTKPMDRNTLLAKSSYELNNASFVITDIQTDYPRGMFVELTLNHYPDPGTMIQLTMNGIRDLTGYDLGEDKHLMLGEGNQAFSGDLVINEILFNPPTGGNEYVEIYNRSDKSFDLRLLSITSRKPSDGSFNKPWPLSSLPILIEPGQYVVVTKSRDLVCQFFNCREESVFFEPGGMPSLANTSGCAVLINNRTEEVIDEFAYTEKMHDSGISNKKAIALERLDANAPTDDSANWHSASEESGYGTPGYENSQRSNLDIPEILEDNIYVSYPSPESGSYQIHYRLDSPGYRCNGFVYDSMGRKTHQIANNELLGTEGRLTWDGNGSSGQGLSSGIYIIYLEIYNKEGKVNKFRKPIVVR